MLKFFQKTVRDIIAQCIAVIASHPFQGNVSFNISFYVFTRLLPSQIFLVITVRMIAQFVGEEQKYKYELFIALIRSMKLELNEMS